MSSYDEHYAVEPALFGMPYPEFAKLVATFPPTGNALDLGCGQGRDALLLARHGLQVTAMDTSAVGVAQMVSQAMEQGLQVRGMVGDAFDFLPPQSYDVIVLNGILHFGEDWERELELLERLVWHTRAGGHLCLFMHRVTANERRLRNFYRQLGDGWRIVNQSYIDFVYQEQSTQYQSNIELFMFVIQRNPVTV
ncbi:class I SAM-dependent methyltransferase [Chitinivorax sp. B]|uniref:class I SAM-dependent methyltransferase n=1 Tax=Chitinivorax sp. B TaxID=2502235 RepID=UPI0010F79880|nr:class I SAM-dependent methyltransferase [Chitinivorax sp. B]